VGPHIERLEADGWIRIEGKGTRNQCYHLQNIDCDNEEKIVTTTMTNSDEIVTRVVMIEERLSQLEDGLSQCLSQLSQLIVTISQTDSMIEVREEVKKEENNKRKIPNPNGLGETAEIKPYDVYEQLLEIEPGMKKGQSLREIKTRLTGKNAPQAYQPHDIIACGAFLQTDPWRVNNMIVLSTQHIMEKLPKWIQAGRPMNYDAYQANQAATGSNGHNPPSETAAEKAARIRLMAKE
jgi:hypothetical protein